MPSKVGRADRRNLGAFLEAPGSIRTTGEGLLPFTPGQTGRDEPGASVPQEEEAAPLSGAKEVRRGEAWAG